MYTSLPYFPYFTLKYEIQTWFKQHEAVFSRVYEIFILVWYEPLMVKYEGNINRILYTAAQQSLEKLEGPRIDPFGQPKVTAGRDHCFRTCCPVRTSPLFKSRITKQQNIMFATGVTMDLA